MSSQREQLEAAIEGLNAQRDVLGNAFIDTALAPLRQKLAALGPALFAESNAAQALKQVAILFLDVVGSTVLSQHLDPEDVHAVHGRRASALHSLVTVQGGMVLQYAGDSLLAVFGADEARENDAERAVRIRAGIACRRPVARRRNPTSVRSRRLQCACWRAHRCRAARRWGRQATPAFAALRSTLPRAWSRRRRPERYASATTLTAMVRGVFDVEPQPLLHVKGIDEPILTYLVQRAKPRAFRVVTRGIEGVRNTNGRTRRRTRPR